LLSLFFSTVCPNPRRDVSVYSLLCSADLPAKYCLLHSLIVSEASHLILGRLFPVFQSTSSSLACGCSTFFSYMTSLAVIKLRTLLLLVTMNARSCHLNASFVCWLLSTGFVILLTFLLNLNKVCFCLLNFSLGSYFPPKLLLGSINPPKQQI
jgi:hypothetical protein